MRKLIASTHCSRNALQPLEMSKHDERPSSPSSANIPSFEVHTDADPRIQALQ